MLVVNDGHRQLLLFGFYGALLLGKVVFVGIGFLNFGYATVLKYLASVGCLFLGGVFGILVYYGLTFPGEAKVSVRLYDRL